MRVQLVATVLAAMAVGTSAFLPATPARLPLAARPSTTPARRTQHVVEMGVGEAIQAYVDIWVPTFKDVLQSSGVPGPVVKWLHGANMGIVLTTMASFGTYLGYQIRAGNGEAVFGGKTARELHPTLMGLAFLFFFLGGQGGLVLLNVQDQPIMQSKHAITGAIGIALLATQAILPKFFSTEDEENGDKARTAHAVLGTSTMALLFVHGFLGLQLGNSF